MISLPARVFLKHKFKMTADCRVFKFLRRGVDGKHKERKRRCQISSALGDRDLSYMFSVFLLLLLLLFVHEVHMGI